MLDAVAEQRRPTEITQAALANICSRLVDAGVRCVVGASIYAPSGRLAAVILAAYREQGLAEQFPPFALVSWAGRETVGCMGKLLATAHSALRAIPASASKVDVSPRTVANWALSGGWRAYWY